MSGTSISTVLTLSAVHVSIKDRPFGVNIYLRLRLRQQQ